MARLLGSIISKLLIIVWSMKVLSIARLIVILREVIYLSTVTDLESYQQFALQQQAQNNAWSAEQAQKQMDFQKMMSDTAHQREVADLKAAGLNPILSANSGAQVTQGAQAEGDKSTAGNVGNILQQVLQAQSAREVAGMYNAATIAAATIAANASMYGSDMSYWNTEDHPRNAEEALLWHLRDQTHEPGSGSSGSGSGSSSGKNSSGGKKAVVNSASSVANPVNYFEEKLYKLADWANSVIKNKTGHNYLAARSMYNPDSGSVWKSAQVSSAVSALRKAGVNVTSAMYKNLMKYAGTGNFSSLVNAYYKMRYKYHSGKF